MWVLFAFGPYFFAEGLKLSGIMAVLFCGIVMSHYTHYNLSPVTQVTVQQTMRTVSFMAGRCVWMPAQCMERLWCEGVQCCCKIYMECNLDAIVLCTVCEMNYEVQIVIY